MIETGCFPLALPRLPFPLCTVFPGPKKVLVRRDLPRATPNKPLRKAGWGRAGLQSQHAGGCSALFSVSDQKQLGGGKVYFVLHFQVTNPLLREVRTGSETGHGGTLLTACFLWLSRLPFLHGQGPPAQGRHIRSGLGPSYIN